MILARLRLKSTCRLYHKHIPKMPQLLNNWGNSQNGVTLSMQIIRCREDVHHISKRYMKRSISIKAQNIQGLDYERTQWWLHLSGAEFLAPIVCHLNGDLQVASLRKNYKRNLEEKHQIKFTWEQTSNSIESATKIPRMKCRNWKESVRAKTNPINLNATTCHLIRWLLNTSASKAKSSNISLAKKMNSFPSTISLGTTILEIEFQEYLRNCEYEIRNPGLSANPG